MAGPCSFPAQDRAEWNAHNAIVCSKHFHCDMDPEKEHDYLTLREWLRLRGRLVTGKTS